MRFGFAYCPRCCRLNIHGARCVCDPLPERSCDCTYTGNTQHLGPRCAVTHEAAGTLGEDSEW